MRISEWSSDVCSSDLAPEEISGVGALGGGALVDARRVEPGTGGEDQREAPTHAVPDDADLAIAPGMGGEPRAHRLHLVERTSGTVADLAHDGADAAELAAPVEQVRASGEVALAGQPVDLVAQVGGHPERVRSAEHTSELQSLMRITNAVFCLTNTIHTHSLQ